MSLALKLACNIFYIYDFFANPSKAYFSQHKRVRGKKVNSIYFLLFKTKLITSHAAPANCFSIFPSLSHKWKCGGRALPRPVYWIHIFFIFMASGPHIYCVSKGLLCFGIIYVMQRKNRKTKSEILQPKLISLVVVFRLWPHVFFREIHLNENWTGHENMQICGSDETRGEEELHDKLRNLHKLSKEANKKVKTVSSVLLSLSSSLRDENWT